MSKIKEITEDRRETIVENRIETYTGGERTDVVAEKTEWPECCSRLIRA